MIKRKILQKRDKMYKDRIPNEGHTSIYDFFLQKMSSTKYQMSVIVTAPLNIDKSYINMSRDSTRPERKTDHITISFILQFM